ncbi:unnamed protein product [Trifolium pratense]|uniref:Uncharacterized protein n=1 Tax=Trifolium pratense TaxID=57577 RepID=A0ACB0J1J6_TRIPR|nr:unnamed protein product [Trifolium pratense]
MVEKLMTNTIKDDEQCLLPGIRPPELEFPLSSIFVDIQLPLGAYGTRSSSALFVTSNKEVTFYEKHLDQKQWKENTVTYQIRMLILLSSACGLWFGSCNMPLPGHVVIYGPPEQWLLHRAMSYTTNDL